MKIFRNISNLRDDIEKQNRFITEFENRVEAYMKDKNLTFDDVHFFEDATSGIIILTAVLP